MDRGSGPIGLRQFLAVKSRYGRGRIVRRGFFVRLPTEL